MIGRGADAVGCAHCTAMGGAIECRICGRIVCKACAADWTTCDQPSGRVLRLGRTARLRDVDPHGRLGLVGAFPMRMRLVDLRALRWVRGPKLPDPISYARLATDAHAVYATYLSRGDFQVFLGIRVRSLATGAGSLAAGPRPAGGAAVSRAGRCYWYASEEETVEVLYFHRAITAALDLAAPVSLNPFPGRVVQSVFVDDERDLVASGTWGRIALHGRIADEYVALGAADVAGDVRWITIGGSRLVAAITQDGRTTVVVWRIEDNLSLGPIDRRFETDGWIGQASLSRDGAYLAIGRRDCAVIVHAFGGGPPAVFTEHTDAVSFVRFAGDDHLLVTADDDNRVVLRPRTATGYAPVAVSVELPDEPVPLS